MRKAINRLNLTYLKTFLLKDAKNVRILGQVMYVIKFIKITLNTLINAKVIVKLFQTTDLAPS